MDTIIQDTCTQCGNGVLVPHRKYHKVFCSMACKNDYHEEKLQLDLTLLDEPQ